MHIDSDVSRRLGALLLGVALLTSCGKNVADADAGTPDGAAPGTDAGAPGPDAATIVPASGYDALKASDVPTACSRYRAELAARPADPQAAFGAFLSCLAVLPDAPPVVEVFDLCKQPHLDVGSQFFGTTGVFARDQESRKGSSTLALQTHAGSATPFAPITFSADIVRSTTGESSTYENNVLVKRHDLRFDVHDSDYRNDGRGAVINLNTTYEDTTVGATPTSPKVPLSDGLLLDVRKLRGSISVSIPQPLLGSGDDFYGQAVSGSVKFTRVGSPTGGADIVIELQSVVLQGNRSCNPCSDSDKIFVQVNGVVTDKLSVDPKPKLPFDGISADAGPPKRSQEVVMLDLCGPTFSADYLQKQLGRLIPEIEKLASHLDVVLADGGASNFQFKVPAGLLFLDGDIPMNVTDARVLRTALDGVLAGARLAVQYRALSKSFDGLLGTYLKWEISNIGQPAQVSTRDMVFSRLVDDLNTHFLEKLAGFDLAPSKALLLHGLDTGIAALTQAPGKPGILNFQASGAKPFADDVAQFATFLKGSLASAGLQPFPLSPDYKLSLKAFFDAPIDHVALKASAKDGIGVFLLKAGVPTAPNASDRNDSMDVDGDGVKKVLAPIFTFPVDASATQCNPQVSPPTACPARYTCSSSTGTGGTCAEPALKVIDDAKRQAAFPDGGADPLMFTPSSYRPLRIAFD